MKIKQISLNCNIFLTVCIFIILIYVIFYNPEINYVTTNKIKNL